MRVPSHQIYNILNSYVKWVSKSGASSMERFNGDVTGLDQPNISKDRYRKSIMQKVTGNIISKITCFEPNGKRGQQIAEELKGYARENGRKDERNGDTFVFNSIDENNEKKINKLFIDKNSFLTK